MKSYNDMINRMFREIRIDLSDAPSQQIRYDMLVKLTLSADSELRPQLSPIEEHGREDLTDRHTWAFVQEDAP